MSIIVFDTTKLDEEAIIFLSSIFDDSMPQLTHNGDTISTANAVFIMLSDNPSSAQGWPDRLQQRIRTIVNI
jgi:hypothetical protein